jgi:hypothetical protein
MHSCRLTVKIALHPGLDNDANGKISDGYGREFCKVVVQEIGRHLFWSVVRAHPVEERACVI